MAYHLGIYRNVSSERLKGSEWFHFRTLASSAPYGRSVVSSHQGEQDTRPCPVGWYFLSAGWRRWYSMRMDREHPNCQWLGHEICPAFYGVFGCYIFNVLLFYQFERLLDCFRVWFKQKFLRLIVEYISYLNVVEQIVVKQNLLKVEINAYYVKGHSNV